MNFIFPNIGNVIIPSDKLILFRGAPPGLRQPPWGGRPTGRPRAAGRPQGYRQGAIHRMGDTYG